MKRLSFWIKKAPGHEEHDGHGGDPGEPCLGEDVPDNDASKRDRTQHVEKRIALAANGTGGTDASRIDLVIRPIDRSCDRSKRVSVHTVQLINRW